MNTEIEVACMLKSGMRQLTMATLKAELHALGYEVDPSSRCAGTAKNMTNGNTYPSVTWGVREIDSKRSAFHVDSRRDERFKFLQELRQWTFIVSRGNVVSV